MLLPLPGVNELRLASAILYRSSRRFTDAPVFSAASMISAARRYFMVCSLRLREKSTIQRMASVVERRELTSMGTW